MVLAGGAFAASSGFAAEDRGAEIAATARAIAAVGDRASGATGRAGDALLAWADAAAASEVRSVVEKSPPQLSSGVRPVVDRLFSRPAPEFRTLAADLAARLEPEAAERALLDQLASPPPCVADRVAVLAHLGRIACGADSWPPMACFLAHGDPTVRGAAKDALLEAHDRLLALSRSDDADLLLAAAVAVAPDDAAFLIAGAVDRGLYRRDVDPALASVDGWLARHRPPAPGAPAANDVADAWIARVALMGAGGRDAEGAARAALESIGRVPDRAEDRALSVARLHLVRAVFLLRSGDDAAASIALRAAIVAAPGDRQYAVFDSALSGRAGAFTVLEALRRRGEPELPVAYYRALIRALAGVTSTLALPEPPAVVGGDEERVKSWAPLRLALALEQRGRLDEARAAFERVVASLSGSDLFNNRWMCAEAHCASARTALAAGALDAADRESDTAAALFEELDAQWRKANVKEMHWRFPPGTPPAPHPLAEERARALVVRSEVLRRRGGNDDGARSAAHAAVEIDPTHPPAIVVDACFAADGPKVARAERVLATMPRRADCLYPLARLAARLSRPDAAAELLETHLEWNALTDERRAIERERIRSDADFAAFAADSRWRALRGD